MIEAFFWTGEDADLEITFQLGPTSTLDTTEREELIGQVMATVQFE